MQRYKSKYTGPQMDVAFERALPGGAIDQSMSSKLDWEGLINPEFTVAQAGIGGNHGSVPYAADCWKLVSGTVSAAPGGGLVLNGTIRQTLETAVGFDAVASINVTSGTATAAYDDATKQFDITSSGGTIKRAHLGLVAIADWSKLPPTNYGKGLQECQRRFQRLSYAESSVIATAVAISGYIAFQIGLACTMRTTPTVVVTCSPFAVNTSTALTALSVNNMSAGNVVIGSVYSGGAQASLITASSDGYIDLCADLE